VILDERKTLQMSFCRLAKSGEAERERDDAADEDEEFEDAVDEGRAS
jgi:hypothetical protein